MSILSKLAVTSAAALSDASLGRFDLFIDSADGKLKAYDATNTLQEIGGASIAADVDYTITVPANWDGTPADLQQAVDELASRVRGIEGITDFITVTAPVDLDDVKSKADSALQSGDNVSELANDAGYITSSSLKPSFNVDLDSSESSVSRAFAGGRTTFTVTHNLNTLDIKPEAFRLSDGRTIGFRMERISVNKVEVSRNGNIADGDYRLVI